MVEANRRDGVWGAVIQPTQGFSSFGMGNLPLLSELCRITNDWIADFCATYPKQLRGVGMVNVRDVEHAAAEIERAAAAGVAAAFTPDLRIGSVEHELAWIPHRISRMDFAYYERKGLLKEWRSTDGMVPSDHWHRNFFGTFMEDGLGVRFRHVIGVDNVAWGNDFPRAESTGPNSREFLDHMFAGVPDDERWKMTCDNAVRIFGFDLDDV
jgi:hypothetical protein